MDINRIEHILEHYTVDEIITALVDTPYQISKELQYELRYIPDSYKKIMIANEVHEIIFATMNKVNVK